MKCQSFQLPMEKNKSNLFDGKIKEIQQLCSDKTCGKFIEEDIISSSSDNSPRASPIIDRMQASTSSTYKPTNVSKKHNWIENSMLLQEKSTGKKSRKKTKQKRNSGNFPSISKLKIIDSPSTLTVPLSNSTNLKRSPSPIVSMSKRPKANTIDNPPSPILLSQRSIKCKKKPSTESPKSSQIINDCTQSNPSENSERNLSLEIENFSNTQSIPGTPTKSEKDESVVTFTAPEVQDSPKKRRRKLDKNSLCYQITKLVKSAKSDYSLWQHEMYLASKGTFQIPRSEDQSMDFKVLNAYSSCEKFLIDCVKANSEDKYTLLVNDRFVKSISVKIGSYIRLYKPFFVYPYTPEGSTEPTYHYITNAYKIQNLDVSE